MQNSIKKAFGLFVFLIKNLKNRAIPVCYSNEIANVGDDLNVELFRVISNKKIIKPAGIGLIKHVLAVGSVLGSMNHKSVVWGSGLISKDAIHGVKGLGDIRAIRGYLSQKEIESKFDIQLNVPFGDPALLMPRFFKGAKYKKYKFALVPHYVDVNHKICALVKSMGGRVITVDLPVEEFINKLSSCEKVLSSSMHGLILADAYDIPNKRIVLSNNIVGGDFKFNDYYSTTDNPNEGKVIINHDVAFNDIEKALKQVSVKKAIINLDALYDAFPFDQV